MRAVLFNAVALGELTVDFTAGPSLRMQAKAAFINTENGKTHGWTTCSQWSKETVEKLAELRAAMENDIASMHFADATMATGTSTGGGSLADTAKGLGERLGAVEEGVPQG